MCESGPCGWSFLNRFPIGPTPTSKVLHPVGLQANANLLGRSRLGFVRNSSDIVPIGHPNRSVSLEPADRLAGCPVTSDQAGHAVAHHGEGVIDREQQVPVVAVRAAARGPVNEWAAPGRTAAFGRVGPLHVRLEQHG